MMIKKKFLLPFAFVVQSIITANAYAIDWRVFVNVINVETTYIPSSVVFTASVTGFADGVTVTPNCNRFEWNGGGSADNVKATLGVILTAMTAGKRLRIYGLQAQPGRPCFVEYFYMENS